MGGFAAHTPSTNSMFWRERSSQKRFRKLLTVMRRNHTTMVLPISLCVVVFMEVALFEGQDAVCDQFPASAICL